MFAVINIWASFTKIGFENVFLYLAIVLKTIIFMWFLMFTIFTWFRLYCSLPMFHWFFRYSILHTLFFCFSSTEYLNRRNIQHLYYILIHHLKLMMKWCSRIFVSSFALKGERITTSTMRIAII